HRAIDFILKNDRVAHYHGAVRSRGESGPRAEPGEWLERHAVHSDTHVGPRPSNANYAVFGGGRLRSGGRGNLLGIELMRRRRGQSEPPDRFQLLRMRPALNLLQPLFVAV